MQTVRRKDYLHIKVIDLSAFHDKLQCATCERYTCENIVILSPSY